jgi:hypothetical protein
MKDHGIPVERTKTGHRTPGDAKKVVEGPQKVVEGGVGVVEGWVGVLKLASPKQWRMASKECVICERNCGAIMELFRAGIR